MENVIIKIEKIEVSRFSTLVTNVTVIDRIDDRINISVDGSNREVVLKVGDCLFRVSTLRLNPITCERVDLIWNAIDLFRNAYSREKAHLRVDTEDSFGRIVTLIGFLKELDRAAEDLIMGVAGGI